MQALQLFMQGAGVTYLEHTQNAELPRQPASCCSDIATVLLPCNGLRQPHRVQRLYVMVGNKLLLS